MTQQYMKGINIATQYISDIRETKWNEMFVKMYFVLLIGLLVCVQGQHQNNFTTSMPTDLYLEVCLNDSGANPSDVLSFQKGYYNKLNQELKKFVFCYLMKTGIMSSTGVLRQDVVLKNIPDEDQNAVEATINKCLYSKAHDPVDTAWHYLTCFRSEKPHYSKNANRI